MPLGGDRRHLFRLWPAHVIALHRARQQRLQRRRLTGGQRLTQLLKLRLQVFEAQIRLHATLDAGMLCRCRVGADEQFFAQLLAGTQPHVLDLDIAVLIGVVLDLTAHKADHRAGEIVDLHRLAHVEHEHLAACRHRAGLNHQRRRFRDRHEIADHARVRNGHRPAARDLLAEQPNHRARAVEHIAEPHHGKNGPLPRLVGARLQDHLGEPLAGAHQA